MSFRINLIYIKLVVSYVLSNIYRAIIKLCISRTVLGNISPNKSPSRGEVSINFTNANMSPKIAISSKEIGEKLMDQRSKSNSRYDIIKIDVFGCLICFYFRRPHRQILAKNQVSYIFLQ